MVSIGQIACKTIGIAGSGLAIYDAIQVSKISARQGAHNATANFLENAYYNSRTIDNVSVTQNNIRKKTFNIETKLPLPTLLGKIKGGIKGFFSSLGNALPLVACSALALVGKGRWAKGGAIGVGCCLLYNILRNGLGLGKEHPMR